VHRLRIAVSERIPVLLPQTISGREYDVVAGRALISELDHGAA
jgi:hypothetical protein